MKAMTSFDQLEDRVLLAGNVTSTLAAGTLTITGDDAANDIQIFTRYGADFGTTEIVVRGNTTSINGVPVELVYATGTTVTRININMGRGDDVLDVDGLFGLQSTGANSITINGGFGSDTISVADVNLPNFDLVVTQPADTFIETPTNNPLTDDGDDVVSIGVRDDLFRVDYLEVSDFYGSNRAYVTDVSVTGSFFVNMGADDITADDSSVVSLARINSTGLVSIGTGDSGDTVIVSQLATTGDLVISTFGQNDDVAVYQSRADELWFLGGEGTDLFNVYDSSVGEITITNDEGGATNPGGEERTGLYNTIVSGDVTVTTDGQILSGNDLFVTERLFLTGAASRLSVDLGDGDDVVYQVNSGAYSGAAAAFDLGDGDDQLSLNGVSYGFLTGAFSYTSGEGDDQFSAGNGARFANLSITDVDGTNEFYLSDLAILNGLTINAAASTQNTLYTARAQVLGGTTNVTLGSFADSIQFLDGTSFRGTNFTLTTGAGADVVNVNRADFRISQTLDIQLGGGNDTFTANGSDFQVNQDFTIGGGSGTNTGAGTGNARNKAPTFANFTSFTTFA